MKEGKVFKRILAVALVVVMTITMVPFGVFATDAVEGGTGDAPATECAHNTGYTTIAYKNATCEAPGNLQYYQCNECKAYFNSHEGNQLNEEIDPATKIIGKALGHDFADATCTEPKKCRREGCGKTEGEALGHSFTNYVAKNDATCTADGTKVAKCDRCDETDTIADVGSKLAHSFTNYTSDNNATCITDGTKTAKCDNCDATDTKVDENSKVDHTWNDGEITTPATCRAMGVKTFKCTTIGCNETRTEDIAIDPTAHSWNAGEVTKNPTCNAKGEKTFKCTNGACKETKVEDVEIDANAHSWNDGEITTPATCKTVGVKTFTCANCNKTKTEDIPTIEHTWSKKNVKKDDNQHAKKCSFCNEFDTTTLENHIWKLYETTTKATCTTEGEGIYRCTSCEAEKTDKIAAKEHSLTKTEAVAATCTKEGNIEYYTCSKCDKKFADDKGVTPVTEAEIVVAKAAHKFTDYKYNNDESCEKNGTETAKCDNCDETYTRDKLGTMVAHTFKNYVSDNNATCIKDGTKTATCEMCKTAKHTVEDKGSKDNAPHVPDENGAYCTLCGKELTCVHVYSTEKLITKTPTCTEAGQKAIVCSKCQAHKPDSEEVIPALGHKWDEGTVTTAPTCKEKGAKLHKCENAGCDETKVEEMAIVDHDYQPVVTQPTCTEDGYTTYTCSMCKSHYVDDQVDAFGHMFDTYYYDEGSATCYQDGTKTATCSNGCGAKNTVADPGSKTDHEVTDFTVIKEATCLEEGEQEAKCFYYDKCGYSEIVPIDALGHDIPADFVTDKEPTCTEKGSKSKKCTRCSETVATEEIPALGHAVNTDYTVDVAATCLEAGKQSKHCARCDYKEGETTIPALGHDYQPAAGTEATCLEGGYAKFTCTRCADTYEEANSPALGHNFVYISDNNATCKEDGTESGKCSRCDATDTRTQVGSKLSHVLGEPVVTPATTKADGVITKTCTLCNDYNETEEIAKIAGVKLTYTVVAYDGKYKRPGLTITDANGTKLVKGEDYTLVLPTKEECSEIGTFTYTINFMGNYKGKGTISYKVVPGKAAKLVAKTTRQSYITLKWSAVKGADGYRVYVKNSKGNWKKLATVKGKNYYKVEDLKAGTEYEFAVKAYAKTDDGTVWATEYIEGAFKTLPGKTSKITYKSNKSAVKLTWKEVKGADGYRVYVYNTKTKKYTTVATVKGKTSYTVKELKAGTTYKFAVKAYYKYDGATVWSNQYTTINTKTAK